MEWCSRASLRWLCSVSIVWFVVYAEFFLNTLVPSGEGCSGMDVALALTQALVLYFRSPPSSRSLGLALCNDHQVQSRPVGVERLLLQLGGLLLWWERTPGRRRDCTRRFWSFRAPVILAMGGLAVVFGCISAALQACANRLAKSYSGGTEKTRACVKTVTDNSDFGVSFLG